MYTAPHAPAPSTAAPATAAAATGSKDKDTASAPTASVPSSTAADVAPAPATESVKPNTLLAAAIPAAGVPSASGGSEPILGNTREVTKPERTEAAPADAKPVAVGVPAAPNASEPVLGNLHHITSAPNTDPATATPGNTAPIINKSSPEAIETVAANANIGQEATEEEKTLFARAQEYGAGAAVTLGAALGSAAHVVEDVTGLNLTHGAPVSDTIHRSLK